MISLPSFVVLLIATLFVGLLVLIHLGQRQGRNRKAAQHEAERQFLYLVRGIIQNLAAKK